MMISVIIPVYKNWDLLAICLKSLADQTFPQNQFEIVLVNNDPKSGIPENFNLPSNARVINQMMPGSYSARNKGMIDAKGEVFVFTDSDCIPDLNWLEKGMDLILFGYDMVGGDMKLFKPEGGEDLAYIYESRFGFNQRRNVLEKGQSITANLFCKKEVVNTVGPFPEGLMSGGDFVWTQKATSSGFRIAFGEDVIVKHPSRKSISELVKKKKRTIGGMYTRFYKSYSPLQKLRFSIFFIRPHLSIFTYKGLSIMEKTKLFFATWYVECVGMKEMLLLDFNKKSAERS